MEETRIVKKIDAELKMKNLLPEIEKLVEEFNTLQVNGEYKKVMSLVNNMNDKAGEYVHLSKVVCFETIVESVSSADDILLKAATVLRYETIRIKEVKDKETRLPIRSIETVTKPIDPLELQKYLKGRVVCIGKKLHWEFFAEKANMLNTIWAAQEIGNSEFLLNEIKNTYKCNKKNCCKEYSDELSPLEVIQDIISACVGEEIAMKATTADLNYLKRATCKKDGKRAKVLNIANHNQFRQALMDVMNDIINRSGSEVTGYTVAYKKNQA